MRRILAALLLLVSVTAQAQTIRVGFMFDQAGYNAAVARSGTPGNWIAEQINTMNEALVTRRLPGIQVESAGYIGPGLLDTVRRLTA